MLPRERLRATFDRLRRTHRKALIPFLMAGDPDLATTRQLVLALAEAGADVIELGVPFSDPLADGPVIQHASARALAAGTTPPKTLDLVASLSRELDVPLVILSYANPIMQYGRRASALDPTAFLRDANAAGVCGVIVPDLPVEEGRTFRAAARRLGIAPIFLAAPTSPPSRLRQIAHASEGFVYYVSVTGTTGARRRLPTDWVHGVRQLKLITTKPVCVGFGISSPGQAREVARLADGVIVGSALIQSLEPHLGRRAACVAQARRFIRRLRNVL